MTETIPAARTVAPTAASPSAKPTRIRYFILALLLIATILNYVDRTNLGIAAPFLSKDLGLDKAQMGQIFAAFSLTYAFALVPGGIIADVLGSRIAYAFALTTWSIATLTQGFANGFNMLFGSRLAIGALESPAFPANARAVTMWFPTGERGFATSVYITGQYIGTPLFAGLLLWLANDFGWRSVFFTTGFGGLALGLAWYFLYRDPLDHPAANAAEIDEIRAGGGLVGKKERDAFEWRKAIKLLTYRPVLAICLGKYCNNSILIFFTTWFMTYLVEARHMTMIKVGIFQALPFLGATAGILLAGFFSDFFIRRGYSMSAARKAPLIIGTVLASSIVLVNFVESDVVVIAVLTVSFFAQGVASSSWAAVSEIAPRQYIGLTSGVTSLAANLAGITTPILIGYILHYTGEFYWALNIMGGVCLIGAFSYSFLLGPLYRIEMD
ncbi:MFS transporter [Siculibacillus lacustris]|uniref:MFS transporter n=1 Tax=Siculibacillus lacustris TaxID=1549641 RepID=A0A4V6MZ39_9HYPH|nr:MFS transporter [Siculibacillus lacustris]TBW39020.1 MFS transporter [Siculibacillus lacustris]